MPSLADILPTIPFTYHLSNNILLFSSKCDMGNSLNMSLATYYNNRITLRIHIDMGVWVCGHGWMGG